MVEYKKTVEVIQILPDMDQVTGERYTQVTLAFESSSVPSELSTSTKTPYWKYTMYIFIPNSKWKGQYKMWQKYNMVIKDSGEMALTPIKEGS